VPKKIHCNERTYVNVSSLSNVLDGAVGCPRDTLKHMVMFSQFRLTFGSTDDPDTSRLIIATAQQQ